MNLLIDMGNSRLKWAISVDDTLNETDAILNTQLNEQQLALAWQHLKPSDVFIACVNSNLLLKLVQNVIKNLWTGINIRFVYSQAESLGIKNAYDSAEKLGVDRWLAMCAAKQYYGLPVCIIDCGTAITIDVLNEKGQHEGGLISAGLTLMQNSLNQATSKLPIISLKSNNDFQLANHTEMAIAQGTLSAVVGFIDYVCYKTAKQNMRYILTGGDAQYISKQLSYHVIIDTELVLRGLALIAKENNR